MENDFLLQPPPRIVFRNYKGRSTFCPLPRDLPQGAGRESPLPLCWLLVLSLGGTGACLPLSPTLSWPGRLRAGHLPAHTGRHSHCWAGTPVRRGSCHTRGGNDTACTGVACDIRRLVRHVHREACEETMGRAHVQHGDVLVSTGQAAGMTEVPQGHRGADNACDLVVMSWPP